MALPTGSMDLLGPVGPDYSQVGDDVFDYWSTDSLFEVVPVTKEVYALWLNNVKRATSEDSVVSSIDGPLSGSTLDICQWRTDIFAAPVEINLGDHPLPVASIDVDGRLSVTTYTSLFNQRYFGEADPYDLLHMPSPMVFIHRDEFYYVYNYIFYPADFDSVTVTIDATKVEIVYVDSSGGETTTSTFRITINERFYP